MRRYLLILFVALTASLTMSAQYVVSDKYRLWFEDSGHEVTTRKAVWCTEDYQDLWNGYHVRLYNGRIHVKNGSSTVVYGDEIALLYNGCYKVRQGSTWYLFDADGERVGGVYGSEILYYPFNYVACQKNTNLWYVYRCNGEKLSFYSEVSPWICWNECWIVQQSGRQYGIDRNGDKISGVYGDDVILLNDGRWKCVRGSYVTYIE